MSNERSPPIKPPSILALVLVSIALLLALWAFALASPPKADNARVMAQNAPEVEFAARGERLAKEINYGDWHKVCFKTPGLNMLCRTTISGTWDTGQSAVRMDLIEREGDSTSRLQLFLPVGVYLPAGVKLTIDQGLAYALPYVWCLTNSCIAADVADPKLIEVMEAGQKLKLEVVDTNLLTVNTLIPLGQFAAARSSAPAQVYEHEIDE